MLVYLIKHRRQVPANVGSFIGYDSVGQICIIFNAAAEFVTQFFGAFGEAAGKGRDEAELPHSAKLYDLLRELSDIYGKSFRDELFDSSYRLRDDVMVSVNKAVVGHGSIAETDLKIGDVISLFPIFTG